MFAHSLRRKSVYLLRNSLANATTGRGIDCRAPLRCTSSCLSLSLSLGNGRSLGDRTRRFFSNACESPMVQGSRSKSRRRRRCDGSGALLRAIVAVGATAARRVSRRSRGINRGMRRSVEECKKRREKERWQKREKERERTRTGGGKGDEAYARGIPRGDRAGTSFIPAASRCVASPLFDSACGHSRARALTCVCASLCLYSPAAPVAPPMSSLRTYDAS